MTQFLVLCDDSPLPDGYTGGVSTTMEIRHRGRDPDLNLRIQNLSHALLATVDNRAADLVRIASYVYAVDQSVRRGGPKDVYGRDWQRQFLMSIPVTDPSFWNTAEVKDLLSETLFFLSEDRWEFYFTQVLPDYSQLVLEMAEGEVLRNPSSVVLLSGGADSLCAAIEAVTERGGQPVVVSHRSNPALDHRQSFLVKELRRRFPSWDFPHISVWIHRRGAEAIETTQRTRSFLYATLGCSVAAQLGLAQVLLADNGVVSINLPKTPQLVGTYSSRSTHPKFIKLYNSLIGIVFSQPPDVVNPFWNQTRADTLDQLVRNESADLLQETVSCAHTRRPLVTPHCGVCSQCVDRRFGVLAAGLAQHDLAERYGVDIFTDELQEGDARTHAEAHVRFAREIARQTDDGLFEVFPQLFDCILPEDPDPASTAREVIEMLRRHTRQTLGVIESQVQAHATDLIQGTLPASCLIRLVAAGHHLLDNRSELVRRLSETIRRGLPPVFRGHSPTNESEVQDAVDGLIKANREALDREVPFLPFAGIGTKPDFSSITNSNGWLFVEVKYPRTRQRLRGVITEITSRATVYRRQGASVFFPVYDPNRCIQDDEQFTRDVTVTEGMWVFVCR